MTSTHAGKLILVTGATGFMGGRLVEKLILYHGARVRTLMRRYDHACRLARFPVDVAIGDITDQAAVDKAVEGCNYVMHCAHDWHSPGRNIAGVDVLSSSCLRHGVKRCVFVSTGAVYEPTADGVLDETNVAPARGWVYHDTKRAMEEAFLKAHRERGLPVAIAQPTIVYGPFSQPWTVAPMENIRLGKVVLPDDGSGTCNHVYIDDVVDALILMLDSEAAVGERFLVSGATPVTWREFYEAFERAVGKSGLVYMPFEELARRFQVPKAPGAPVAAPPVTGLRALRKRKEVVAVYKWLRAHLGEGWSRRLKSVVPPELYYPSEQTLPLYHAKTTVSIEKARARLGYQPRFSFADGMKVTAEYICRTTT